MNREFISSKYHIKYYKMNIYKSSLDTIASTEASYNKIKL